MCFFEWLQARKDNLTHDANDLHFWDTHITQGLLSGEKLFRCQKHDAKTIFGETSPVPKARRQGDLCLKSPKLIWGSGFPLPTQWRVQPTSDFLLRAPAGIRCLLPILQHPLWAFELHFAACFSWCWNLRKKMQMKTASSFYCLLQIQTMKNPWRCQLQGPAPNKFVPDMLAKQKRGSAPSTIDTTRQVQLNLDVGQHRVQGWHCELALNDSTLDLFSSGPWLPGLLGADWCQVDVSMASPNRHSACHLH